MSKVNILLIIGTVLVPTVICGTQSYQKYYKNNNNRRVGSLHHDKNFLKDLLFRNDFFDNLYNVEGKDHDKGADFLLTTPIYQHINPFYTKKVNNNDGKSAPAYYPVYNHQNNANNSVQDTTSPNEQMTAGYSYQPPAPPTMDGKSSAYLPPSTSYGVPDTTYTSFGSSNNYGPPSAYGNPPTMYETPSNNYGPSGSYGSPPITSNGYNPSTAPSYASPTPTYGPPSPNYPTAPGTSSYYPNPSMPLPQYGPPMMTTMMETVQKGHEGFLDKIIKKFDLVLMSKMLLKLIIFKKIIKFIAVICLLLFIPVLKKKFEESTLSVGNEDEERRAGKVWDAYGNVDFRVKEVANFALTAIEAFESHDIRWCVGESEFYCRLQYMLDAVDTRYPGNRMFKLWFPNLDTTTTEAPVTLRRKSKMDDSTTESSSIMSSIDDVNEDENLVKK